MTTLSKKLFFIPLILVALLIFALPVAAQSGPTVTIPTGLAGTVGQSVRIPISFNAAGNEIRNIVFAVNYDTALFTFNSFECALASGNPSIPCSVVSNTANAQGEVDVVVGRTTAPLISIPEGELITLILDIKPDAVLDSPIPIKFSTDPSPSFGNDKGQSVSGSGVDGSIGGTTNAAPVAVDDNYTTTKGTELTIAVPGVLSNDHDAENSTLTPTLITDVTHGTLTLSADGSFSYTPAASYSGTDSFTYKVSDGVLDSNIATVNITVNAVNHAPTAVADSYETDEDTTLTIAASGVLSNDTDPDAGTMLTAALVANVAHGTLTLNADGSFSYAPAANYNGSDSFSYKANDGTADSNVATVSLTVNPINDPPTAVILSPTAGTITAGTDGTPAVVLNSSGTSDVEDTINQLSFLWSWTENGQPVTVTAAGTVHNFPVGSYVITLKVTDTGNLSDTKTVSITVVEPPNTAPTVNAGADTAITLPTNSLTLNGTASDDGLPLHSHLTTTWSGPVGVVFGDTHALSTLATFPGVGVYTLTLTATDGDKSVSDMVDITVNPTPNQPPTANAGPDQTVTDNDRTGAELVTLDGSGSTDDGTITAYVWSENGTQIATGVKPQVNLTVGTHTVTLVVTDNNNVPSAADTVVNTVNPAPNLPPTANAGSDQTVTDTDNNGSELVTLDGSGSTDDGTITTYAWYENGNPIATGVNPQVTLPVGAHTFTLVVTDNNTAQGIDTVLITVNAPANNPPQANAGPDQSVTDVDNNGSEPIALNGGSSTDVGGSIISYVWTENNVQIATGVNPQVTLAVGAHTITLTVTDNQGAPGTDTVLITINPPANVPPVANAGPDQTVNDSDKNGSELITLDGSNSTDVGGSIVSYTWTENNVQIATGVNPQVTLAVGVHTITLTVTDNQNATGTDTVLITVVASTPTNGTINAQIKASGDDVNQDGNTLTTNSANVWLGTASSTASSYTGLRFNNITIPKGATITGAQLQVYSSQRQWLTVNLTIKADTSDNSPAFATATRPSTRTLTTAQVVNNTNVQWAANTWYSYTGLAPIIQEVVNRTGWQPNNSISLIIKGSGSAYGRKFATAYDSNPAFAPKLIITYTASGSTNNPPVANAGPDQTVNDSDKNGSELVTLNGSGSTDAGGSIASYVWTENNTQIATGVQPQVTLAVGVHSITLTTTDNLGATGTDTVVITVNKPPVANAGPDQTVTDTNNNGSEAVTLNGSGSSDVGGSIAFYIWKENNVQIATGVQPQVTLAVGVHTITLTVTDNLGATSTDTVIITVNTPTNTPPVANAGPDQTVTDTDNNGSELVTLNGSGSTDVGGSIASYVWTENNVQIATGVNLQVTLPVGAHTITLTVTDNLGATGTDTVVITVNPPSAPSGTVNAQVKASGDDVNQDGNTLTTTSATIWLGTSSSTASSYTGLRFNNITIPKGATITGAQLQVYSSQGQWLTVNLMIKADASDNSPAFATATRPSTRTLTTAQVVSNTNVQWAVNTWYSYTGLAPIIQEVVNRTGWQPNNSISLIIKGSGSAYGRKFITAYDSNPAFAPKLIITYTAPAAAQALPVPPAPSQLVVVQPPTAAYTSSVAQGVAPLAVQFTNQSTGTGLTYSWNFGDGTTSTDANPAHTFASAGTYTVVMTASNSGGQATAQKMVTVTAPIQAPTAALTANVTSGNAPLTVQFSNQSTGTGLSYSWNFGDGTTSADANPSHTFNAAGTYTVVLTVSNSAGSSTAQTVITVATPPQPPVAAFSASVTSGVGPLSVQFSSQSTGDSLSYSWNFGDGVTSTDANPSHTFNTAGSYTVILTVTNPVGNSTSQTTIQVSDAPPAPPPEATTNPAG